MEIVPCVDYRVVGVRYATKDGVFLTENQNELWDSKEEIIWWNFLFEQVLSSKSADKSNNT